jgi:hypothetical protein
MAVMVQRVHLPLEANIGLTSVHRESMFKHSILDLVSNEFPKLNMMTYSPEK